MPIIRGCNIPDELLYDVDNNIWYRDNGDGTVTVGMTAVATAMAGQLVAFTPKKAGRAVQAGKSCATIESGKWVGPAKLAFDANVVEANGALSSNPKLANSDPYGAGWMVKVRPADWAAAKAILIAGPAVAAPYEAKMTADNFKGCDQDQGSSNP
jgi:glycine cleavage system H protein